MAIPIQSWIMHVSIMWHSLKIVLVKRALCRINDYDKWAIKWGYTYIGAANDQEDRKIVTKWIVDSLKANPAYGSVAKDLILMPLPE
jgi:hypothetical protein